MVSLFPRLNQGAKRPGTFFRSVSSNQANSRREEIGSIRLRKQKSKVTSLRWAERGRIGASYPLLSVFPADGGECYASEATGLSKERWVRANTIVP